MENNNAQVAQAAAAAQMRQQIMTAPDAHCGKCQGVYFENVFKVKRVSALMSPNGQEQMAPVQTLRCLECGNILDDVSDFAPAPEEAAPPSPVESVIKTKTDNT
jgi:predicted nucleic acid-binding Zn ribbon protein